MSLLITFSSEGSTTLIALYLVSRVVLSFLAVASSDQDIESLFVLLHLGVDTEASSYHFSSDTLIAFRSFL